MSNVTTAAEYVRMSDEKRDYTIKATGCDDSTTVTLALTADEAEVIGRVAQAVTEASEFSCMPRLKIQLAGVASRG